MKDNDILSLPLFLGLSQAELSAFRTEKLFSVAPVHKGEVLAEAGQRADTLTVVVQGTVLCTTHADDKSYTMEESLNAPLVIQPHRLFGLSQRYSATYTTQSVCVAMSIRKNDLVVMMDRSLIFRINFLNVVTSTAEKYEKSLWHQQPKDLTGKVMAFIKNRCLYPAGRKVLRIHMLDFARELGCSRIEVSNALHELEDQELLIIKRGGVEVPMLERVRFLPVLPP